jgi:ABC-type sugar transport system ATPase subunit
MRLEIESLSKAYGATQALDDVSFAVDGGRVHAILGENGSGKSTLVKVLAGAIEPDSGTVRLDGALLPAYRPRVAQRLGIQAVHQEILVAPNLSVVDNLFIGFHPPLRRVLPSRAEQDLAVSVLTELGWPNPDLRRPAGTLSLARQQVVVIARALVRQPRVLILDEATAALGIEERDALFRAIRRRIEAGTLVLFISHRLDEVSAICTSMTVLRSGRVVAQFNDPVSPAQMMQAMAPEMTTAVLARTT